jgi:hypothetical protein
MKLKLASYIGFSMLVFMRLVMAADDGAVQGDSSATKSNLPTKEQYEQMQQAGILPKDLKPEDLAKMKVDGNAQPGAAPSMPTPAPTFQLDNQPAAKPGTGSAAKVDNQQKALEALQDSPAASGMGGVTSGTGAELGHSTDSKVYDSGGNLKIDTAKPSTAKSAPAPTPPPATQPQAETEGDDNVDYYGGADNSNSDPLPSDENAFKDESRPSY